VPSVQLADPCLRHGEQRGIAFRLLLGRVEPVSQEGEGEVAAAAGEMVDLQPLDLFVKIVGVCQERRHGHQCPKRGRDALLELEPPAMPGRRCSR
jgi:hypothetical protein